MYRSASGSSAAPSEAGVALSLSAFLTALAARLNRYNEAAVEPVTVRAIPYLNMGARKAYAGRVSVRGLGTVRQTDRQALETRWAAEIARPKRKVAGAFLVERPKVVLVTGVRSVAADDIRAALREAEEAMELVVQRVSMSDPAEIARAFRDAAVANLIVLTRGGGHDVTAMDDDELIGAVATSPTMTATALGHATDLLMLDKVADFSFPTPTAFGVWLRNTVEQKRAREQEVRQASALQEARTFQQQLQRMEEANKALAQSLEREANGRREMEAKFLSQQQQLLQQLEVGRQHKIAEGMLRELEYTRLKTQLDRTAARGSTVLKFAVACGLAAAAGWFLFVLSLLMKAR
jgi:hypothetical protein